MNQEGKLNHQVEVQDHVQVQFQEKENLPNRQWDLNFGQVHVIVLKLNLDIQDYMTLWFNRVASDIRNRMRMKSLDHQLYVTIPRILSISHVFKHLPIIDDFIVLMER